MARTRVWAGLSQEGEDAIDKVIVTMILVIAAMAGVVLLIGATYPALMRSTNSIVQSSDRVNLRIETQVNIVFATAELDSSGAWVDADGNGKFEVILWVKNVGSSRILAPGQNDVFLGAPGSFKRVPYQGDAGGTFPNWTYSIENGTEWAPSKTLKVSIHYNAPLSTGSYLARVITPSGNFDEKAFSF